MAVGRMDKTAKIETKRFMDVINMLRTGLTYAEMAEIAGILCAFDENTNKIIYFFEFMKPIKLLLAPPEPAEEKEPESPPSPEPEAFDAVLEKGPRKEFDAYYEEEEKAKEEKEDIENPKEENKEDGLVDERRSKEVKKEPEQKELQEDERIEIVEEPQAEPDLTMTEINEAWCDGAFTVVINRCHNCHQHRDYTWHYEEVRINAYKCRNI